MRSRCQTSEYCYTFKICFSFVKQLFKGNDDSKSTIKRVLPFPVEAKYIRIYPVGYESGPCLRAELYGKGKDFL